MQIYLIRHAQSRNNLTMLTNPRDRVVDPPLTDLGFRQAAQVADYLATAPHIEHWLEQPQGHREMQHGLGIQHLYCSPMLRALQTAAPIASALGLKPEVWIDLHEHGGMYLEGDDGRITGYPGMTRAEMAAAFPAYGLPTGVGEGGWWDAARGSEDIAACMGRAIRVAAVLRTRPHVDGVVALVTHGTFMDVLLKALLSLLPSHDMSFVHYNTAISRIDLRPDGLSLLRYTNRISHLAAEMVT